MRPRQEPRAGAEASGASQDYPAALTKETLLTDARARTATAAERPALWKTMTSIWPAYDEY